MATYSDVPEGYEVANNPSSDPSVQQYSDIPEGYSISQEEPPQPTSFAQKFASEVKSNAFTMPELMAHGITKYGIAPAAGAVGYLGATIDKALGRDIDPDEMREVISNALIYEPNSPIAQRVVEMADKVPDAVFGLIDPHRLALKAEDVVPGSGAVVGATAQATADTLMLLGLGKGALETRGLMRRMESTPDTKPIPTKPQAPQEPSFPEETDAERELRLRKAAREEPTSTPVQEPIEPIKTQSPEDLQAEMRAKTTESKPATAQPETPTPVQPDPDIIDKRAEAFNRAASEALARGDRAKYREYALKAADLWDQAERIRQQQAKAKPVEPKPTTEPKSAADLQREMRERTTEVVPPKPVERPVGLTPEDEAKVEAQNKQLEELGDIEFQHNGKGPVDSPISKEDVVKAGNDFTNGWYTKPNIKVFDNFDDPNQVPEIVRMKAKEKGITDPTAFRHGDDVYINSDHMGSIDDVHEQLTHETDHIARSLYYHPDLKTSTDAVLQARPGEANQLAKNNGYNLDDPTDRNEVASEIISKIGQKNIKNTLVKRFLAGARNILRKMGIEKFQSLDDNDIFQKYIVPARKYMRTGEGKPFDVNRTDYHNFDDTQLNKAMIHEYSQNNPDMQKLDSINNEQVRRGALPAVEFSNNRSLFDELNDVYNKLKDPHITSEDQTALDKRRVVLENEIHQNNISGMRKMSEEGKSLSYYNKNAKTTRPELVPKKKMPGTNEPSSLTAEEAQQFNEEPNSPDNFIARIKPKVRTAKNDIEFQHDPTLKKAGIEKEEKPITDVANINMDKVHQANEETIRQVFDRYRALKTADIARGIKIGTKESTYAGMRNVAASNKVAHEVMSTGQVEWKDGIPQFMEGKKGLMDILDPIKGQAKDFFTWMRGKDAQYRKSLGQEKLFTNNEINELISHGKGNEDLFESVAAEMRDFHDNLNKFTGLMSLEDLRQASRNKYYLPRFEDKQGNKNTEPVYKAVSKWDSSNWKSGAKSKKGIARDPLTDLTENLYNAVDAGMKNEVRQRAVKAYSDIMPTVPEGERTGHDIIKVMNNGTPSYHKVTDTDILQALQNPEEVPDALQKALVPFKVAADVLRATVTVAPTFMWRTYAKHAEYGWVFSQDGYKPIQDTLTGLTKSMDSPEIRLLRASGAAFGGTERFGGTAQSASQALRRELATRGWETSFMDKITTGPEWFRAYRALQDAAENANRVSQVLSAQREGLTPSEQVYRARDLQDYNLKGANMAVKVLGDMVPFLSPKLFSIYKLGGNLSAPRFLSIATKIAVASTLLHAVNQDNEKYKSLTDQEKDIAWHIFAGDHHIRIPKPFEVGMILSSAPEKIYDALTSNDTTMKQALTHILHLMTNEFSIDMPQLIKPAYEVATNKKIGTDLPIESKSDQAKPAPERYSEEYTSVTMRDLGKALNTSPKKLQHLVEGYFGSVATGALAVSDYLDWQRKGIARPSMTMDDIPILNTFYRSNKPDTKQYASDFYNMLDRANQTQQAFNLEGKSGHKPNPSANDIPFLRAEPELKAKAGVEKDLRNQIDQVLRDPKMNSDQKKKAVDELKQKEFNLLRNTQPLVKKLKQVGE